MKAEACFYENIGERIHCLLCPHNCIIENGHFGRCNVRTNEAGKLFAVNYGEITSAAVDPIEKKPLYYFKPGTEILSIGSFGCNFTCTFCQNYSISQYRSESTYVSKEELVERVLAIPNNIGIAFTYNEPSIWYEYVYDCAKLLKEKAAEKVVVIVSNGYIREEPLKELLPYVDAMNIDLKSFDNRYYKDICGGTINPVLKNIELAAKACHVEIATLIVSGENDTLEEIEQIAKFLASIDENIPLHLSRYFPRYKLENPPTDLQFMKKAEETAVRYLKRVKLGNV